MDMHTQNFLQPQVQGYSKCGTRTLVPGWEYCAVTRECNYGQREGLSVHFVLEVILVTRP